MDEFLKILKWLAEHPTLAVMFLRWLIAQAKSGVWGKCRDRRHMSKVPPPNSRPPRTPWAKSGKRLKAGRKRTKKDVPEQMRLF